MSSEFRRDLFSDRWVIVLNNDKDFIPDSDSKLDYKNLPASDLNCPFCRGNEEKCGFNILELKKNNLWQVRVIPNNRPYLKVETPLKRNTDDIFSSVNGIGANEVIIETPIHNVDFDFMTVEEIAMVLKAYKERFIDLKKDERMEYILILKNRGYKAGALLEHLHSQLLAFPVIPSLIAEEISEAENYFKIKNKCVYCDVINAEIKLDKRVILKSENFICIAPFASRFPFELMVMPQKHKFNYYEINDDEIDELARILKEVIFKLNKALGNPAYNIVLHSAPLKTLKIDYYHWHFEIIPKLKNVSGFEWGTGLFINPVPAEESAKYLKNIKF